MTPAFLSSHFLKSGYEIREYRSHGTCRRCDQPSLENRPQTRVLFSRQTPRRPLLRCERKYGRFVRAADAFRSSQIDRHNVSGTLSLLLQSLCRIVPVSGRVRRFFGRRHPTGLSLCDITIFRSKTWETSAALFVAGTCAVCPRVIPSASIQP